MLAPAWMTVHSDPIDALRGGNRATRQTASLPRKSLVVLQAALSLVLLCAAGLLTEALHKLEHLDFGFVQENRTVAGIDPSLAGFLGLAVFAATLAIAPGTTFFGAALPKAGFAASLDRSAIAAPAPAFD